MLTVRLLLEQQVNLFTKLTAQNNNNDDDQQTQPTRNIKGTEKSPQIGEIKKGNNKHFLVTTKVTKLRASNEVKGKETVKKLEIAK